MSARLRSADARDARAVSECVRAAYSRYVERIGKEPAPMLEDYGALVRNGDVRVLVEDEEVVGVLVMRREEDHLFIGNVAVRPDRQGHGLGRRLMDFTEQRATEEGLSEVRLYTNEKMWENLAFYEKLGFEETGRRLDEGYHRVFLRKRLYGHDAGRPENGR